jgi:hypothetical protein
MYIGGKKMEEESLLDILERNEKASEGPIKIPLLVSVHPNNKSKNPQNKDEKDYQILILNPKYREYFALIRQIAVIQPCNENVIESRISEKEQGRI